MALLSTGNGLAQGAQIPKTARKYRIGFLEASAITAASLMINLLSLAIPLAILMVYDRIIPNQAISTLTVIVVSIVVVVGFDLLLRLTRLSLEARVAARLDHLARTNRMHDLLSEKYPNRSSMSLNALQGILSQSAPGRERKLLLIKCLADFPFAVAFLVIIGIVAGDLVLLPVSICAAFLLLAIFLGVNHRRLTSRQQENRSENRDFVDRVFDSLAQVKSNALDIPVLHRLMRMYRVQAYRFLGQKKFSMTLGNVFGLFSQLMIASVSIVGAFAVLNGDLSHGGLAAFTLLAGRALEPMRSIYELATGGARSKSPEKSGGLAENGDILVDKSQRRLFRKPPTIKLEMTAGEATGLPDQQFNMVADGGTLVAVSARGSMGKTTLAHGILGLIQCSGGVWFDDIELDETNADAIRNNITLITRKPILPRGRMLDILSSGSEDRYADVRYLCHLIGLDEAVKRLPDGYDTMIGDDPSRLPEGLLQQVAIVRGLVANNKVVIIDDVTLLLDARSELRFAQTIKMLRKTATIIMLTDRPSLTAIADKRYLMDEKMLHPVVNPREA
ncbi:ATP-binding cassette domain-containing protein [Thalassospira sp. MA62]|nr:ATP-binding cassette domain-containing protein [Thalassospira sp. MA62]